MENLKQSVLKQIKAELTDILKDVDSVVTQHLENGGDLHGIFAEIDELRFDHEHFESMDIPTLSFHLEQYLEFLEQNHTEYNLHASEPTRRLKEVLILKTIYQTFHSLKDIYLTTDINCMRKEAYAAVGTLDILCGDLQSINKRIIKYEEE